MSQQIQIKLDGVLSGTPSAFSWGASGIQDLLPIGFCTVCAGKQNDTLSALVSSSSSLFSVPFGTITKARVLAFKVLAGTTITLHVTTAKGTAILPVSDEFLLLLKNPGDEATSISIDTNSQQVDVAYLVAGDIA